ncbi:hypothetical protein OH76DRAFT_1364689, partial [Lentinus brumalis]
MSTPGQEIPPAPRPKLPKFKKYPRVDVAPPSEAAGSTAPAESRHHTRRTCADSHSPSDPASVAEPLHPPADPTLPLTLRRNRFGAPPPVTKAHDAKVASPNVNGDFVITSPNTEYVPEYPVEREVIHTFRDGRWGLHEYSRWPQAHVEGMLHVACIPRRPSPPDVPSVLWATLLPESHWEEDPDIAVSGFGYIKRDTRDELEAAAEAAIRGYESIPEVQAIVRRYGDFLCMILRQVVDRMTHLPSVASRAVAVAAHVQRVCLELAGLKTYLEIVVPRLHSRDNFSERVLDVVGAFLNEGSDVYTWWRAGLPYWLVQPLRRQMPVWRVVEPEKLSTLSSILVDPPILHARGAFIGATNFTGNWLSSMVMSVSKHVSGSHLAQLNLVAVPALPSTDPTSSKRPRIEAGEVRGEHLSMRAAPLPTPVAPEKKKRRRHKRRPQASGSRVELEDGEHEHGRDGQSVPSSAEAPSVLDQPARNFTPPAFYDIPQVWERALRAVSPVKHTEAGALY